MRQPTAFGPCDSGADQLNVQPDLHAPARHTSALEHERQMIPNRRAIIHIGVEKTGTTSIQRFLAANRAPLKALGYWYSSCLALGNENHVKLCGLAQSQTPKFPTVYNMLRIDGPEGRREFDARVRREFDDEIAQLPDHVHTLIFSNEHLHSNLLEQEETRNLRAIVGAYASDIKVLAYLRRQDQLSVSLFSTRIKGGEPWTQVLPTVHGPTALPYYFDYDHILRNYGAAFGEPNIIARVFERARMKDGDLVADFLEAAGIPDHPSLQQVPRQNESLSRAALYTLSLLNTSVPPWIKGKWNMNRDNLVEILEEKFAYNEPLSSREETEAFYANFQPSNEAVRARYFPSWPSLFDEDFSLYPAAGSVLPPLAEVADIFGLLWSRRSEIARNNAGKAAHAAMLKAQADMVAALKAEGRPVPAGINAG
jgi:hypothetical protein